MTKQSSTWHPQFHVWSSSPWMTFRKPKTHPTARDYLSCRSVLDFKNSNSLTSFSTQMFLNQCLPRLLSFHSSIAIKSSLGFRWLRSMTLMVHFSKPFSSGSQATVLEQIRLLATFLILQWILMSWWDCWGQRILLATIKSKTTSSAKMRSTQLARQLSKAQWCTQLTQEAATVWCANILKTLQALLQDQIW